MKCVTSPRLAIFLEWSSIKLVQPGKRNKTRIGDPISPLLFLLCIERHSHVIIDSVNRDKWKGISLS